MNLGKKKFNVREASQFLQQKGCGTFDQVYNRLDRFKLDEDASKLQNGMAAALKEYLTLKAEVMQGLIQKLS